ncbi:unnamed protein product [Miscanthus lutarioriparius]|uniref:Uncharacterized protein n=1 Tax=Miscanthus lutarioriparius TaxID=422564 RepID=A0A811PF35_9POAL|nr:unnamed protein product [Miscanthus lutarioriparius]
MACSTGLCFSASIPPSSSLLFFWLLPLPHDQACVLCSVLVQAPKGKRSSGEIVVMVDPLEAKRLAAKQMQEIRAKEKLKRRRQAEAINGALAMIGLTVGLVVEAQTGKGILGQLAGYLTAISSLFGQ